MNAFLKIKMETNVSSEDCMAILQKLGHSAGYFSESIIQGMQTYRLVRTATVLFMFCSASVVSG